MISRLKLSRDNWLGIGLGVILVASLALAAIQELSDQQLPTLMADSKEPNGGRALILWMEQLGLAVDSEPQTQFEIPAGTHLILILEPLTEITPFEWNQIDEWVEAGGTLLFSGQDVAMQSAADHYEMESRFLTLSPSSEAANVHPLLLSPPIDSTFTVFPVTYLETERSDILIHATVEGRPVVVSFREGEGQVVLSTLSYTLTNQGLQGEGVPKFVLNLLTSFSDELNVVWYDQWHHGIRAFDGGVGPSDWLRYQPAGRAIIYLLILTFVAIVLSGRRLGRPIVPREQLRRRSPLEYVDAMAGLRRRAGHRVAVQARYYNELKRQVGRRYRINPTLPDDDYLAELERYDTTLDLAQLKRLLGTLRRAKLSEGELVQAAQDVDTFLNG